MTYNFIAERSKLTPLPDARTAPLPSTHGVDAPCNAYEQMRPWWEVIKSVKGGTPDIRKGGKAFLPHEPFEREDAYGRRLGRSCFAPWYVRLVRGVVGMVLRKPIALQDVVPAIESHLDNINLLGDDLNSFAREVFEAAIDFGYTGIFVNYPKVEEGDVRTRADEVERGYRPYWVHYTAPEIIGWRYSTIGNRRVFTQLRIRENSIEPSGEFGEAEVERIKVYDLFEGRCRYRLFQEIDGNWMQAGEDGFLSLPYIPFTFIYTDKKREAVTRPPMLEVAYLNINHFQLSSDLNHSLHITAHPKLVLYGYNTDQGDVVVGADEALVFDNPDGRAEWIAPPPTSFDGLNSRIDKLEQQMAMLGLSTLVGQKNVGESAEAKKLDRVQGDSIMSVIAQGLQDAFDLCLEFHAAYMNQPAGTCQVNRDFDVAELTPQAIDAFSRLHSASQISLETLLTLLKKGEIFDDEFDIEEEIAKLESEFKRQAAPVPSDTNTIDVNAIPLSQRQLRQSDPVGDSDRIQNAPTRVDL